LEEVDEKTPRAYNDAWSAQRKTVLISARESKRLPDAFQSLFPRELF
jgi:hypothetical protein